MSAVTPTGALPSRMLPFTFVCGGTENMSRCTRPGCAGSLRDGFCEECGMAPAAVHPASSRSTSTRTGTARAQRRRLGAGLVELPPVPYRDPRTAVLDHPEVPEHKRFCGTCGDPVG